MIQTPPTARRREAATVTTAKNLVVTRERLQEAMDAAIELYRHQCELDAQGTRVTEDPVAGTLRELIQERTLT